MAKARNIIIAKVISFSLNFVCGTLKRCWNQFRN